MNDDRLAELLTELPSQRASLGFTRGVLRRIDERRHKRATLRRFAAAAIVTIAVAGVTTVTWIDRARDEARQVRIEAEGREIRAELEKLKAQTTAFDATVSVAATDEVEYVIDVDHISRSGGAEVVYAAAAAADGY